MEILSLAAEEVSESQSPPFDPVLTVKDSAAPLTYNAYAEPVLVTATIYHCPADNVVPPVILSSVSPFF